MQSQSCDVGGTGDTEDGAELSQHELDQEYLYRLWKAGRICEKHVQMWATALSELQAEANCDYFVWLMKNQPMPVSAF